MPNVGQILKQEIVRLARREANASLEPYKKAVSQHRKSIAELKRQVSVLARALVALQRQARNARPTDTTKDAPKLRFVAKGLASHRARLGLSAGQFGQLVGVSGQSVYDWEAGKTTPRASQLARIAELRALGKRDVQAKLRAAEPPSGTRSPRKR